MNKDINKTEIIRVLQVMDKCAIRGSPIHGVSRLLLTWWPAFRKTKIDMSLCVLRGGFGTCSAFEDIGVDVQDLGRSKIDPRTIIDLRRIIKRDNIHILHCHGYGATTFGRVAGLICGIPVIVQEHMVDKTIPWYQKLVDKLLAPFTFRGVAISNAVKDFMIKYRAINKNKMTVVYNTIPVEYLSEFSDDEKNQVRKKYNLPDKKIYVGIVGRLDEIKGHQYFLEAARQVLESCENTVFIVVGDGELSGYLKDLTRKLGLADNVLFLGHCNDVLLLTSVMNVVVSTSLSEGLGLALTEAMAQGVPVVATEVGGVPELIIDNESGLLVPAKDSISVANAIIKLLENDDLRHRLAAQGKARCADNFIVSRTVKDLQEIYSVANAD